MPELFQTVYGRGLVPELKTFVHRPYLVVTMEDLWPRLADAFDEHNVGPYFVTELERSALDRIVAGLPACESVIGLGRRAGDRRREVRRLEATDPALPGPDGPVGQRRLGSPVGRPRRWRRALCRLRHPRGRLRRLRRRPERAVDLNRSGVGDILCYWTGLWDWRMASDLGKVEQRWPYDQRLADESQVALDRVIDAADEIHAVSDAGIRALAESLRYGGTAFHNAGWNPRHIEGAEHFVFYNLEFLTGKHFLHRARESASASTYYR